MDKLYKGIRGFREEYFKKEEEFFKRLSKGQKPEVLFVTCADSRVDPALVTQSRPGDLFIVRNVGNIIPPYDALKDKNSVAAAIEFAVLYLKVNDIIICGHSDCGAIEALYKNDSEMEEMPHLRDWLKIMQPVKNSIDNLNPEDSRDDLRHKTETENILAQIENIQTYPFVAQALKQHALYLHGWYYNLATGYMYAYNPNTGRFEKIM